MNNVIIHKNKEKTKLPYYSFIKIPQYKNIPKYSKFKNFLEGNIENERSWPSCDNQDIGALEVDNETVSINLNKCIGCLMCFSSHKNLTNLEEDPKIILSKIFPNEIITIIKSKQIFNGKILNFPYFPNRKTNSFKDYTSIKETTHISLWSCSVLNFLSSNPHSKIGKEIEIIKMDNPRDGRLDVCIDNGNDVFVGETKVGLDSLLNENRYRVQIPSYTKECQKFIEEFNKIFKTKKVLNLFLIIGGKETDLLPPNHPDCSSRTGNKSKRFYKDLIKFNIKFISADAILLMMLYSLYYKKRLCWDLFFNALFDDNVIGLLTAGLVYKQKNGEFEIRKIPYDIINSSEQVFS